MGESRHELADHPAERSTAAGAYRALPVLLFSVLLLFLALSRVVGFTPCWSGVCETALRHESRIAALVTRQAPDAAAIEEARSRSQAILRSRPADAAALGRLAALEAASTAGLSQAALNYLVRSYEVAPLGPDVSPWRMQFAFDHWSELPPELRQKVMIELGALFPRHGWALRDMPNRISDPSGRLAAALAFDSHRREAVLRTRRRHDGGG
jgi:hypothetical protein